MDMTEAQILPDVGSGIAKVCLQMILSLSLVLSSFSLSLARSLARTLARCLSLWELLVPVSLSFSTCISMVSLR